MRFLAPDEAFWVGHLRLVLYVPESRSLKDKRRVVNQVRDRLRAGRNLSVAEVGHLEHHSRTVLAVAMVANDPRFLRSALDGVLSQIQAWHGFLIEEAGIEVSPAMRDEEPDDGPDRGPQDYDGRDG